MPSSQPSFIIWRSDLESDTSDVFLYKAWQQIFVPHSSPKLKIRPETENNLKEIQQRLRRNTLCGERKANIFGLKVIFITLGQTSEHIKLISRAGWLPIYFFTNNKSQMHIWILPCVNRTERIGYKKKHTKSIDLELTVNLVQIVKCTHSVCANVVQILLLSCCCVLS